MSRQEVYRDTLHALGPRLRATLLSLPGSMPQNPVDGQALIDTGAAVTCVDRRVAEEAGLSVVGERPMSSATHANEIAPIYAGLLRTHGLGDITLTSASGANLGPLGLIALVGRDVLKQCTVFYNGPEGLVTLSR